jgi:hypothetical protein
MEDYSQAAHVLVGFAGASSVEVGGRFRATLVAPRAAVTVTSNAEHSGSFFARAIDVGGGSVVYQRGFLATPLRLSTPQYVCAHCNISARTALEECRATKSRVVAVVRVNDACAPSSSSACGSLRSPFVEDSDACPYIAERTRAVCYEKHQYRSEACAWLGLEETLLSGSVQ